MRLIVNYGPRTAIVVLDGGATMFDLVEKCAQKVGMKNGQFDVCLDVAGRPVIEDMKEVYDGDSLRLVTKEEGAPHKKQRTTSATTRSERSVHNRLRDDAGYVRVFAGHEDGNAMVRCALAALGDISPSELSVPTNAVKNMEVTARANIVQSKAHLSPEWKNAGHYDANEAGDVLCAVAAYYQTPVVVLDLVLKQYTSAHQYLVDGSDGAVSLDAISDCVSGSILLERKATHYSAFLHLARPTTKDEAYRMHANGFGICYDRSKYVKVATEVGILTKRALLLPRDCAYVPVIFAHMNLNGIARQTLNLLDLTFREECERREQCGDIAPRSCIAFMDKNAEASGLFVRKDILHLRNAWGATIDPPKNGVSPLDVRRELRSVDGILEGCESDV
jgi:hypothetical protein